MDAFFDGLDGRLRVSGMVADSIMMGIVNSAMENAYKKSLSKEGNVERLNEKSRFCELAIMQLEWCLKYLQDEIHGNVIEGTGEREQLLSDLLKTRDRIHHRLQETEFAIAEKDKELTRRKESESKLRMALEMKGEEVSSLHTALGLERVKSEKASGFVQVDAMNTEKNEDHVFGELKDSLHRQLQKIRGKLDDGREILTNLMQKKRRNSSDVDKLTFSFEFGVNGGGMKSLHELYDIAQLKLDFKEIVVDVGILTEKIESSFEMMGRSVSLLKAALDEQQWVSDVEKETSNLFIKSYLQETQHVGKLESGVPAKTSPPALLDMNWSAIMDDITSLRHELEVLFSQIDMQSKTDGSMDMRTHYNPLSRANAAGKYSCNFGGSRRDNDVSGEVEIHEDFNDTSSKVGKSSKLEDLSKENQSGHFVADLIHNHESVIWKKSQEINWLRGELSREKGCSLRKNKTFDSVEQIFIRVISRLDDLRRENAKLGAACDNHRFTAYERPRSILRNNSSIYESVDKEIMVTQKSKKFLDQPRNRLCFHLGDTELCEEIRQLEEGNVDLDTKAKMLEEKCTILSEGLMRGIHLEVFDYDIETLIREDIYRVILSGMTKEWNNDIESYSVERLLKEETACIVFSEVIKDMIRVEKITLMKCPDGEMPFGNNLSQTSMFRESVETMQEVESPSNDFKLKEGLDFNCNSEPEESYIIDRLLKEEIRCIVFSEAIKDMICLEIALMKCPEADMPFGKNLSETSAISDSMESMQEAELHSNDLKLEEGFDFNCNSELLEPHSHLDLDGYKIEVSNALNLQHIELLFEKNDVFKPVERKFELHHFISSKMHLSKSVPCLFPLDNSDLAHDLVTSASGTIQNGYRTTYSPTGFTGKNWTELQLILMPLTKFSQVILDFEFMVFDKIKVNISRLEYLNSLLNPLIEEAVSIKRNELLYHKAFTRRCYDLQTAEAEVDLLGDEVDLLLGLIQKIYISLDHYSPVLQHYFGIRDVLTLIRQELM